CLVYIAYNLYVDFHFYCMIFPCNTNFFYFFFQAEDGIRDRNVTGVSDVCSSDLAACCVWRRVLLALPCGDVCSAFLGRCAHFSRSEERRVGKECRSRWWQDL